MWKASLVVLIVASLFLFGCGSNQQKQQSNQKVDNLQEEVMKNNGTEPPFQNEYWDNHDPGIYVDAETGKALFSSTDKFDSGTGWPSFTKTIGEVTEQQDTTLGMTRTEVRSEGGHLGHWFGDGPNGSRYCINSASLQFIPYDELEEKGYGEYKKLFTFKEAYFAGGCFWGVEHLFAQLEGVVSATSGYMGGDVKDPTYAQVSSGKTGHAESVKVVYDPEKISYRELIDYFWRLHDPTELNRQGLDVGTQYRSAIFYNTEEEKQIAEESKEAFDAKGVFDEPAVTEIVLAGEFYKAEDYHQDYIEKNPQTYCHPLRDE